MVMGTEAASNLLFITNATEAARLDSSGNLGLGVTPSAWNSVYRAFQIGSTSSLSGRTDTPETQILTNAYRTSSGAYNYIATNFATRYEQTSGVHSWHNAPSGTAGNAFTFTQAMTLDSGGNLGIGTTAPNKLLTLYSSTNDVEVLRINVNGGAGGVQAKGDIGFGYYDSVSQASAAIGFEEFSAGSVGASLLFKTRPDGSSDSTRPSERARIDSSGNLLVGQTSDTATSLSGIGVTGNNRTITAYTSAGANGGTVLHARRDSDGNAVQFVYGSWSSFVGSISVTSTLTTYNVTSDYRLKTVIGAVTGQGARIDALEPVEYTWNSNGSRTRGFLAHKFQEIYADSVTGTKDAVDADGKPVYQSMQAATSEVIADLVAEIKALRVRVAQLESN
jgi:hypothetical protein